MLIILSYTVIIVWPNISTRVQSSIRGPNIQKLFSSQIAIKFTLVSSLQITLQTLFGILITTLSITSSMHMIGIYSNLIECYVKGHILRGCILAVHFPYNHNQEFYLHCSFLRGHLVVRLTLHLVKLGSRLHGGNGRGTKICIKPFSSFS